MKKFKWLAMIVLAAAAIGAAVCFIVTFRNEIADFFGAIKERISDKRALFSSDWEEQEFGE